MVYVKVFLEDTNDNRPVFYPLEYAASISTQSMPGTAVLRVAAHDKDEGLNGRVTYRIVRGNSPPLFSLNKDTGERSGSQGRQWLEHCHVGDILKTSLSVAAWPPQQCSLSPECICSSPCHIFPC